MKITKSILAVLAVVLFSLFSIWAINIYKENEELKERVDESVQDEAYWRWAYSEFYSDVKKAISSEGYYLTTEECMEYSEFLGKEVMIDRPYLILVQNFDVIEIEHVEETHHYINNEANQDYVASPPHE